MIELGEPKYLTICEVPESLKTHRVYYGPYLHHALTCLRNNCEDNAASWILKDERWQDVKPVAGTLKEVFLGSGRGIELVDARDVAKELLGLDGEGI